MSKSFLIRLLICIFGFGYFLYSYIDKQNQVTTVRFSIPALAKDIKAIQEENTRLQYEIDHFENPQHLMELARGNEFTHLKHPLMKEIVTVGEGIALQPHIETSEEIISVKPNLTLAVSANN